MPVNPYERLKEKFRAYVDECEYRRKITMFCLEKSASYTLDDVYERIKAAEQLGFDVVLETSDDAILIRYAKKLPSRPWEIR